MREFRAGKRGKRVLLLGAVAAVLLVFGVSGALGAQFHGIAFTKGCEDPTNIGDPYTCAYQILNVIDTGQDTLVVTGLSDQVHAASGDVNSGNILGALELTVSGGATCSGGSGTGTAGDPYIGATSCTLPFGSTIETNFHSFYTVQPADYQLPNHVLTDTASLNWHNTCTAVGIQNCTTDPQTQTAGSSSSINKLASSTASDIHNAAHSVVTAVQVGTTVHDFVTVTGQPGQPIPSGNVNIDFFLNGTCSGSPAANSGSIGPLDANGQFDATGFNFTVNSAGFRAFRAHYEGDGTYSTSDGPCESLRVVDANIQITDQVATNPVGTTHTLTGHVNVNDGNGQVNAPAGTEIDFSLANAGGATATFLANVSSCLTVGTTGSCTVDITSPTAGTTTINASTDVVVATLSLHRSSGDTHAGDSPNATKYWADDTVTTNVRDAANNDVTGQSVTGGTVVHDEATVAASSATPAGVPAPTGTATFTLYDNGTCNGNVVATDANEPLDASGLAPSVSFTTPVAGGSFSYTAHYNGDANYPAQYGPCEAFTVTPATKGGKIAPTSTTCQNYTGGTASTLKQISYTVKGGKITTSINPGVFFFYTEIITTTANQVVTVSQTNTSTNNTPLFGILNGQAILYTSNCAMKSTGTLSADGSGASFIVPTPGHYIIGIKYQTKTIAAASAPVPSDITYNFATSLGGNTGASVLLKKH